MSNPVDVLKLKEPAISIPATIEEAVALKQQYGEKAEFASGATLLQLQWMNGRSIPEQLISLEHIKELNSIIYDQHNGELSIGAVTPLGSYKTNKILKEFPILCNALKSIAAPAIRNRGTIGGNIIGRIGDLIPLLIALNAELVFRIGNEIKHIGVWDWYRQAMNSELLLTHILIPLDKEIIESYTFFRKIGRREAFTSAILTVSGKFKWDETNIIQGVSLAIGGGDNKAIRLENTEQLIIGRNAAKLDWKTIYKSITEEFVAAEDAFVSSNYRKKVAANLIVAELQSQFIENGNKRGVSI